MDVFCGKLNSNKLLKVEVPKKKVKKTNIPVAELVYGGIISANVQKTVEKEFKMALQDIVMEEIKDTKNDVEAYVYEMRNKEFFTDPEREEFIAILQQVEDWLYEDGEDETKVWFKEHSERGAVIDQFVSCINSYREAAMSNDPKFDHIEVAEKQKVLNECVEAEAWLREKQQQQESLPKHSHSTPAILSADVRRKAEALDRIV